VAALAELDRDWRRHFGRIVTLAQGAHRTRCCALAVLDGDTLSYRVGRGFSPADSTPDADITLEALFTPGGIVVPDARRDRRLSDVDRVRDGTLRFYAGHRITTRRGEPVAVLSVFDPAPRLGGSRDLILLRRFAAATQERLNALLQARRTTS
jgi:hypothetical protein